MVALLAGAAVAAEPKVPSAPTRKAPVTTPGKAASDAALPAVNLAVELRQVDEVVRDESAQGGSAKVFGTGQRTPAATGAQWQTPRTAAAEGRLEPVQLRLRNGGSGRVSWRRHQAFEWVGEVLDAGRVQAAARQAQWLAAGQQLEVAVRWQGGAAPAAVDFSVDLQSLDTASGSSLPQPVHTGLAASVLAPLDRWVTLARSPGAAEADPEATAPGSTSTLALRAPASLLQMRVRLLPAK